MTLSNAAAAAGPFTEAFARLDARAPIYAARQVAFDRFMALGLPTTKHEDWKYTSVRAIAETRFAPAPDASPSAAQLQPHLPLRTSAHQLVFVNGRFSPDLSELGPLPGGVRAASLANVLATEPGVVEPWLGRGASIDTQPFTALNTALFEDGAFLLVPRGVSVEEPIQIVFVTTAGASPFATHPRLLVVAERESRCTIVETYLGLGCGPALTNAVTEIVAGPGSSIEHDRVVLEGDDAFHVGWVQAEAAASSEITSSGFVLRGRLVRVGINGVLAGEGAHATFNGLTLARAEQHVDHHLWIDHLAAHCTSWEYYKSVLDDRARAVFAGRIYVAEGAQKTDAKQTSMNLLLSDDAMAFTKPQLEIFADDVKCTHGATVGQLDPDQLFYLRARGISEEAARSLLIYAFANESIEAVGVEELRESLAALILERLPQGDLLRRGDS